MSDSVWPQRWKPTRLPRPWDSPGKNTGVGCHFLLQCMKVKSEREVAQLCPTLSDPMDYSLLGSSIHGIFQARVLEWGAIAFSKSQVSHCISGSVKSGHSRLGVLSKWGKSCPRTPIHFDHNQTAKGWKVVWLCVQKEKVGNGSGSIRQLCFCISSDLHALEPEEDPLILLPLNTSAAFQIVDPPSWNSFLYIFLLSLATLPQTPFLDFFLLPHL